MPMYIARMEKIRKRRGLLGMSATAVKVRRVVIDFPGPLFDATEHAAVELAINRSSLIREAVVRFLGERQRQKLEKELAEGYIANAGSARALAEDMMGAERDFN
jgi:metal-responsive CopG/Arc/MetJ family transcriptional regulator